MKEQLRLFKDEYIRKLEILTKIESYIESIKFKKGTPVIDLNTKKIGLTGDVCLIVISGGKEVEMSLPNLLSNSLEVIESFNIVKNRFNVCVYYPPSLSVTIGYKWIDQDSLIEYSEYTKMLYIGNV